MCTYWLLPSQNTKMIVSMMCATACHKRSFDGMFIKTSCLESQLFQSIRMSRENKFVPPIENETEAKDCKTSQKYSFVIDEINKIKQNRERNKKGSWSNDRIVNANNSMKCRPLSAYHTHSHASTCIVREKKLSHENSIANWNGTHETTNKILTLSLVRGTNSLPILDRIGW